MIKVEEFIKHIQKENPGFEPLTIMTNGIDFILSNGVIGVYPYYCEGDTGDYYVVYDLTQIGKKLKDFRKIK